MAPHSDLPTASTCSDASNSDGWVNGLSPEEIGFLQLYDGQWLNLDWEKVVSFLKGAYALAADLNSEPQVRVVDNAIMHSGYSQ
jgi:hypothetical protein